MYSYLFIERYSTYPTSKYCSNLGAWLSGSTDDSHELQRRASSTAIQIEKDTRGTATAAGILEDKTGNDTTDNNKTLNQSNRSSEVPRNNTEDTDLVKAIKDGDTDYVKVLLQEGALIEETFDGKDNVFHVAAKLGHSNTLKELLDHVKTSARDKIDARNSTEETALFIAIKNGHTECIKVLLQAGASIEITLPNQYNVFHVAAEYGNIEIFKLLLDHDESFTINNLNSLTTDLKGYAPIHLALANNHVDCVHLLLSNNVSIRSRASYNTTLLDIAAQKNNVEFAKLILESDATMISNVDSFLGMTPLHHACFFGSKDVARLLIMKEANLLARTEIKKSAIEIMMNNISKPTEFLESIFDTCVCLTKAGLHEPFAAIDYSILVKSCNNPSNIENGNNQKSGFQLEVIEALLKTGNSSDQKRLLIHPLVESFICLKWKVLEPFFYAMFFIYSLFVLTLTIFIMTDFGYKDCKMEKPFIWDTMYWTYALYVITSIVWVQELIFLNIATNLKHNLLRIETILKVVPLCLAIVLPTLIEKTSPPMPDAVDWARHLSTTAVLLSWLNMVVLLAKFPFWGCYILMFQKVFSNMVKILLTFACLVIGFALSFMIQFHHQESFDSFRAAFIKTMVMITSEFDYDDLIDEENGMALAVIRVIFFIFLILAPIVLMNLMVSVAVSDLKHLKVHGRVLQLEKQFEIMNDINVLVEIVDKQITKWFPRIVTRQITQIFGRLDDGYLRSLDSLYLFHNPNEGITYFDNNKKPKRTVNTIPQHITDIIFKQTEMQEKNKQQTTNQLTHLGVELESIKNQLVRDLQIGFQSLQKKVDDICDHQSGFESLEKQLNQIRDHQISFETLNKQIDHKIGFETLKKQLDEIQIEIIKLV